MQESISGWERVGAAQATLRLVEHNAGSIARYMRPDHHSQTLLSRRASVVPLDRHEDNRGVLVPIEFSDLPFEPRRAFTISGVPAGTARGGHAHRNGRQFLVCPTGRVRVRLRDRTGVETVVLDRPDQGLLIEPGVWSEQVYELDETVLLVFVSQPYDGASDLDELARR